MDYPQVFIGLGIDGVAIFLLVFAIYYRRYRQPQLLVALVALNLGVFAAVTLLESSRGGLSLGFGLFGILSIVRLRSSTLSQSEVGYYFIALTLGLVNGLGSDHLPVIVVLNAVLLAVMYGLDSITASLEHRQKAAAREASVSRRTVTLEVVHADEVELRRDLERRLGAEVVGCEVTEIDYIRDVMVCDVRCRRVIRDEGPFIEMHSDGSRRRLARHKELV